ncbi:MAG: 50S ribosomal protein L10 [Candidatus Liberibacter europaeus]|uniref:Large ribosomal subunit protein uL10 n=1 Tax=Candidatus Liberibacter europaeus TaxID=744859 RepID=A0A2T4VY76_9HYPH|nr:50S ribosomal protein L10 [Candidatus Liberibacter europaeus]PTL86728.1 MAG: 50S ribosomal protein L10 [Candidatus Liberibacter europaeus]
MKRQEKVLEVVELGNIFSSYSSIVVAHYKGINVAQIGDLRKRLREAGGRAKVIKNRLVKIAIRDTDFQGMSDLFSGQSLIVYSKDPVVAPKISVDFAKDNDQFVIIGGVLDKSFLDSNSIKKIASMPSIDVIRAKIIASIQYNSIRLIRMIKAPPTQIIRIISAYSERNPQE